MNFLEMLVGNNFEEGSPMADLKHVLLQDGKYVPLDERPVPAIREESRPFQIFNHKESIMSRVFGEYGSLFVGRNSEASESLYDVITSCNMALLDGEIGSGRGQDSLEVIVDDRNAPRSVEADTVIIISPYPVRLRRVDAGALLVYAPSFQCDEVRADANIAIFTQRCSMRRCDVRNGTIFSPEFRCPDGNYKNVVLISNNRLEDDHDNPLDFSISLDDLDQRQQNKIFNAATAFGDLALTLSEQDLDYLSDEETADLIELSERLTRGYREPRGRGRGRRGNRRGCRNDRGGFFRGFGYNDWEDDFEDRYDDDFEDFFEPRRGRGRRDFRDPRAMRGNRRNSRGRTNTLMGRLGRLENWLTSMIRGNQAAQPARPAQPANPAQPAQPAPGRQVNGILPLSQAELAQLNNLTVQQLRTILAPMVQANGVNINNTAKDQLVVLIQAVNGTIPGVADIARALVLAGVGQQNPQPGNPQQPNNGQQIPVTPNLP